MTSLDLQQPLRFTPIFKERIWGGRRLHTHYGKPLPPARRIGESWEIVDRAAAQSVVAEGPLRGRTLHELWQSQRRAIFGELPETERFPLLVKLLDAEEKLSLQVHPPAAEAARLGGEPKTEFWYVAEARAGSALYVGLRRNSSRAEFEAALDSGVVEQHVHQIPVRAGDAMFLPSGRMHAIGAGNLIVEIQQNSDTTFRVFDWNRRDDQGQLRELHLAESLRCIDFADIEPALLEPNGESLLRCEYFEIEKWKLTRSRLIAPAETFAIVACLSGEVACAGVPIGPGEFLLVPACLTRREVEPRAENTSLLRVTVPETATR